MMNPKIAIRKVNRSRISEINFSELQFGSQFTDHMFSMEYRNGSWCEASIIPFGMVEIHPVSASLHYGQSIFEGLKAYRGQDGKIRLFRPEMNYRRMMASCERMCIPPMDEDIFLRSIEELVKIDHEWVPPGNNQSLYIRPVLYACEGQLDVRPAHEYRYLIILSPVGGYFKDDTPGVSLKAEEKYTRAIRGGTGAAKTGGNYAATFMPAQEGKSQGYEQVLWLDGEQHQYIEEVGQMNICFHLNDKLVTPELTGTILHGVTRDSVLKLARDMGVACEERQIDIQEIIDGIKNDQLHEAFGCGTAVVIAPVKSIGFKGKLYEINDNSSKGLGKQLYDSITGIQRGTIPDPYGWTQVISV